RAELATPERPRIGVVSNLDPVKGVEDFVRAAAIVRAAHPSSLFEVAGDGPLREPLERLIAELGMMAHFRLHGRIGKIESFLERLDIAVLPSRSEGMSNALLEYMAAGKPIVATAVGANPELIRDGVDGVLVPPGDPQALAQGMRRLLEDWP